jgi:hypothetical protein
MKTYSNKNLFSVVRKLKANNNILFAENLINELNINNIELASIMDRVSEVYPELNVFERVLSKNLKALPTENFEGTTLVELENESTEQLEFWAIEMNNLMTKCYFDYPRVTSHHKSKSARRFKFHKRVSMVLGRRLSDSYRWNGNGLIGTKKHINRLKNA